MRALTGLLNGRPREPESSVSKLYWSEYHQSVTTLALQILGADALTPTGRWPTNMVRTDDPGAPDDSASWVGTFLNARAGTIYAGTSQVQRNILGEQVLGLPKEPRADAGPWNELQRARRGGERRLRRSPVGSMGGAGGHGSRLAAGAVVD